MRVGVLRHPLRRPAVAPAAGDAPAVRERWLAGEEASLKLVPLEEIGKGVSIVVTEMTYFMAQPAWQARSRESP